MARWDSMPSHQLRTAYVACMHLSSTNKPVQCLAVENSFDTLQCRVVAAAAARAGEQAGAPKQPLAPAIKDTRYLLLHLLCLHG